MADLTIINLPLDSSGLFLRGNYFLSGKLNNDPFCCLAKSGSQSLWLPIFKEWGLKVFHPEGTTNTRSKAETYFKAQEKMYHARLAPKPNQLLTVNLHNIGFNKIPLWKCHAVIGGRVFNGGYDQVLDNIARLGVKVTKDIKIDVEKFLKWHGCDALTLMDYKVLTRFDSSKENLYIDSLKAKLPPEFRDALDILSTKNIVFDDHGELKVIDFDLSEIDRYSLTELIVWMNDNVNYFIPWGYEDLPHKRSGGDIDICIDSIDYSRMARELKRRGYLESKCKHSSGVHKHGIFTKRGYHSLDIFDSLCFRIQDKMYVTSTVSKDLFYNSRDWRNFKVASPLVESYLSCLRYIGGRTEPKIAGRIIKCGGEA